MTIDWGGSDQEMLRHMEAYADKVIWAVEQVALYFAPILESRAKEQGPWTDRTGNLRQALAGYVDDNPPPTPENVDAVQYVSGKVAEDIVTIYLSHGLSYGLAIETKYAGRFSIIWSVIQETMPEIEAMLKGIFRR
jgi:hypothetical protein